MSKEFNRCSGCHRDYEVPLFPSEDGSLRFCISCHVTYAKNREGFAFMNGNEVYVSGYNKMCEGRIFIIKGIFIYESCESGRVVHLVDKETGRPMKKMIDVNWLTIIQNKN
jgi:hypothetical protein